MQLINCLPMLSRAAGTTFLVVCVMTTGCLSNLHDERLHEMQAIQAGLPVHPSFVFVKTSEVSKITNASVSALYQSAAGYDDVKGFYIGQLQQQGWHFIGEREMREWGQFHGGYSLDFKRGEYRLAIQYAGKHEYTNSWDYAIAVGWG